MERVEEQVQAIDETLNDKASVYDMQNLENKLQLEIRERSFQAEQLCSIAQGAEKLCNRLADDAMTHIDELKSKVMSIAKTDSFSSDQGLKQLESRINSRLASSVEELASIIKDYAKKHKKLSDKVNDLAAQK
jgi:hypothetical protein